MSSPVTYWRKHGTDNMKRFYDRMDKADLQMIRRTRSCRVYGLSYGHQQLLHNGRKPR